MIDQLLILYQRSLPEETLPPRKAARYHQLCLPKFGSIKVRTHEFWDIFEGVYICHRTRDPAKMFR